MTRFPTTIDHYMTSVLVTVEPAWPVREAIRLMREHDFHHLPVVSHGRVVGLVSLQAAENAVNRSGRAPDSIEIRAAMDEQPYVVDPEEPADRVARGMAERRTDCALVAHGERLLGMFTATDALQAFAALLEDERVPGESTVAASSPKHKVGSGAPSKSKNTEPRAKR
jgi:acetoin utilization protein AcuB